MRSNKRSSLAVILIVLTVVLGGCIPEANRERGGGAGGDIGNHGDRIEMHGPQDAVTRIYYETPTMGLGIEASRQARENDGES